MTFRRIAATLACLWATLPAMAQEVSECDWRASAWNLVEPWGSETRTFANDAVRLAILDTIEPGAAAFNILVLSPPYDELGGRQCRIVSLSPGIGFYNATLAGMTADYDPSVGLIFAISVDLYDPDTSGSIRRSLRMILNQASGAIAATLP